MFRPKRPLDLALAITTILVVGMSGFLARPVGSPGMRGQIGLEAGEVEERAGEVEERAAAVEAVAAMRGSLGSIPLGSRYVAARGQVLQMLRQGPVAPGAFERQWIPLGPDDVGGRVRALVVDPTNTDVLYAGGVAGGVWKSLDAGASWRPLTETFANVGVSTIAMDPRDSNVLYVGTGEYWATGSSGLFGGVGILKTADGGSTWRLLPETVGNPDFSVVHDIVVSAADSNVLYAGVSAGVARSGDGGKSWDIVYAASSGAGCSDLAVRTDVMPDVLLASCADISPDGVYRSGDGGTTWAKVIDEVNGERAGFSAITFAPNNQDIAYASVSRTWDSPGGETGTLALLRSSDGGSTWSVQNDGSSNWLGWCGETGGQGYYGNAIAVDPTDPERVWLGGIDGFRSDDGGRTMTIAAYWYLDQNLDPMPVPYPWVHADYHAIVFDPGYDGSANQTIYFATDGGISRTRNAAASLATANCQPGISENVLNDVTYEPLNHGLAITQFWAGTVSDDGSTLMAGAQDNGTWVRPEGFGPGGWRFALGGDGFDVAITPAEDLFYAENPDLDISRSETGQLLSFEPISGDINDSGLFFTPLVMDPHSPSTLWVGGHSLWRSQDGGDLWVQASDRLLDPGRDAISAIAVAPSDSNVVYAGSSRGDLFVSTDATASPAHWARPPAQDGYVTSIAIHPGDSQTAYATVGTFDVPHVLKSTDGGATWTDIGGDLPNVPASSIAINPLKPEMVFVGTDAGAFESHNGGITWFPANGNLASTIVQDLVFRAGTSELYLFTHGRGAFRVDVGTGE